MGSVGQVRYRLLAMMDRLAIRYHEETGVGLLPERRLRWHQRFRWRVAVAVVVTALVAWFASGLLDREVRGQR